MTNTELLKEKIENSGLKMGFIANRLGISYGWLNKKINGEAHFKAVEIQIMCDILNITDLDEKERIFFATDVEEIST